MGLYTGRRKWLIYGRKKVGKTFWLLSASRYYPKVLGERLVSLKDLLLIAADENALSGAEEVGLNVPYTFDLTWAVTPQTRHTGKKRVARNYREAFQWAIKAAKYYVMKKGITTIGVDTVSTLGRRLLAYYMHPSRMPKSERSNKPDTRAVYGYLLRDLTTLLEELSTLPCNVIFLCHSTVNESQYDESYRGQAVKEQTDLPGGNDIVPEIVGKSLGYYEGNVDVICVADALEGNENQITRILRPYGDSTWRGGTRYSQTLKREEKGPLIALMNRIESNQKKWLK